MQTLTPTKPVESAEERMIKKAMYEFYEKMRATLNGTDLKIEVTITTDRKDKIAFMNQCNPALIFRDKPESYLTGSGFSVVVCAKDSGLPY